MTQTNTIAIKAEAVVKNYGAKAALRSIDLEIPTGGVTILLGSNGAGKSTLLRVFATLTRIDSGNLTIHGLEIMKEGPSIRANTGAALHAPMLYGDMSVRENLMFSASILRLPRKDTLIYETAEKVGIQDRLEDRVRSLSHGLQKKVSLARAIMHEPSLLLLDEPESGLDGRSVNQLDQIIAGYRSHNRTVVMTTHIIEHGLEIADHAVVLQHGNVILMSNDPITERSAIMNAYASVGAKL